MLATALQPQVRGEPAWGRAGLGRSHQGWTPMHPAIPLMISGLQADIDATQWIITRSCRCLRLRVAPRVRRLSARRT